MNSNSSRKIDIIDFFSNKKISEIDENLILRNKNLDFLKKIIVKSYPGNFSLIHQDSIALGDGSRYITDISQIKKGQGKIAVFNLVNEITGYVFENAHIFIDRAYRESFTKFFISLKNIYTGLTEDFLKLCVGYLLYKNTGAKSFKEDSDAFLKIVEENKKALDSIKINTAVSKNLSKVFRVSGSDTKLDYSLTNVLLSFKLSVDEKKTRNESLLGYIIKNIKLDDTVCAMASKEHGIKANKSVSKKMVKEWFMDGDGNGNYSIKNVRGLSIKIKSDDYQQSGLYYTGVVSNSSSNLNIRLNWGISEKAKFLNIYNTCSKSLANFVEKLKEIGVYTDRDGMKKTSSSFTKRYSKEEIYSFITYSSLTYFTTDFYQIKKLSVVERKFPQFIREDSPEKVIKFRYQSQVENLGISIRSSQNVSEGVIRKINAVEVLGGTPYTNYELVIGELADLFIETVGKKVIVFEEGRLKELEEPSKKSLEKKVIKKNIKVLGDVVDSVSCQKKRQPKILENLSNTLRVSSYSKIKWMGKEYYCDNKDFPYPGFTSKRSLCCFTKPQKEKEIYKTMISSQQEKKPEDIFSKYPEDSYIIDNSRIIKNTGSVIQPDKLGEVPEKIKELLYVKGKEIVGDKKGIFRLGVKNSSDIKENLLLAVARATGVAESDSKVKALYKILNEKKEIKDTDFFKNVVLSLGVNVAVISAIPEVNGSGDNILCNISGVDFVFPKTILLLKSFDYIFDIVVLSDGKSLTKTFDKKSTIYSSFYKNYKNSCKIKFERKDKISPPTIKKLLEYGMKITSQFSTDSGVILYVNEEKIGVIPVVPYNYSLPGVKVSREINKEVLHDISKKKLLLESSGIKGYSVIGYIRDKGGKNKTSNIVLSCGIPVPVITSNIPKDLQEIKYPVYYGLSVDSVIGESGKKKSSFVSDYFHKKTQDIKRYSELYLKFKEIVVNEISNKPLSYKENLKKNIESGDKKDIILKIDELSRNKAGFIQNKKLLKNYTRRLSNDFVVERKNILDGTWSKYKRNEQNFVLRESEIILVSQEDIKKHLLG